MARIQKPPPARLILSIVYSSLDALADALKVVEKRFGRVQFETMEIPCSDAALYREEMGAPLLRRLFSFERLVSRDALADIKNACHKIEPMFADHVDDYIFRTVNIDPGILTPDNLVMASHREYNHRLYLKDGVFAEIALIYAGGQFKRLPWTHPDLCHREAIDFFLRVRESFETEHELHHKVITRGKREQNSLL
jgi:hypothetical protein